MRATIHVALTSRSSLQFGSVLWIHASLPLPAATHPKRPSSTWTSNQS
jgi:hypothetical protein